MKQKTNEEIAKFIAREAYRGRVATVRSVGRFCGTKSSGSAASIINRLRRDGVLGHGPTINLSAIGARMALGDYRG